MVSKRGCRMPPPRNEGSSVIILVRWMALAPDSTAAPALLELLDEAERARADRFRFAADRHSYVAAHALLRVMLAGMDDLAPRDWRFRVMEGGKPELDPALGRSDLRFSLSHTRGMAACAVGCIDDLGVDVENCSRQISMLDLARRFFAPAEAALVAAQPPADQSTTFFRLWTLKEAYLKATGQGILGPLDAFSCSLDPVAISFRPTNSGDSDAWQFAEAQPGPSHRLAIAVRHPRTDPLRVDMGAAPSLDRFRRGPLFNR